MTRRELLAFSLAAAFARGDTGAKTAHLAAINDEIGLTPEGTIAFAKQYGVQWLEMRGAQIPGKKRYYEALTDSALRELKKQLTDNGLRVSVLDSALNKVPYPGTVAVRREDFYTKYFEELGLSEEAAYRDRLELLKRAIHVAHFLGTPEIRVFAFWRVQDPAPLVPRIAEVLAEEAELAHKEKCRLLLETETSTNIATSDEIVEMMRLVPSPGLGINWDPQNSIVFEATPFPTGYEKLPKHRIGNVHVKAEGLLGPRHPLDWGAIMHTMLNDGYTGHFSLETHRGGDGEGKIKVSRQCMEKMVSLVNAA